MAPPKRVTAAPPLVIASGSTQATRDSSGSATRDTLIQSNAAASLDGISDQHDPEATLRPVADQAGAGVTTSGYTVHHELGRGGMGLVHQAEQRTFGRTVALKTLLVDTGPARRAFMAEAVATARLEHPNIVPVHDLVIGPGGVPQLSMKMVEGSTWKALLHPKDDKTRAKVADWEIDNHLEILLKVCDAVSFAHTRQILHRDLKPENVMVGDFGEVLVMDWGCAIAFGDKRPHPLLPLATESRMIAGTPAYMAPELALGDGAAAGPWSDVYLLGAILYEILCGSAPHRSKGGVKAVLEMARIGEIEAPEQRAPGKALPDELVALALEAMAREPHQRLRDVASFAARLRDYLRHSQAATLLDRAREHLKTAESSRSSNADESLRRAIGCCEQAQELWPGFRAARRLHVRVALAAASNAVATGSFHLARTQAEHARRLAKELNQSRDVHDADAIVAQVNDAEVERANRARQVRLLRQGLMAAGAVVVAGLLIGITLIGLQQRTTSRALDDAKTAEANATAALESLKVEQAERLRQGKEAAPRFLAGAENDMRSFRWDDARRTAEIATTLDPDNSAAWQLLAEIYCGDADLVKARAALNHVADTADHKALLAVINHVEPRLRQVAPQDRRKELLLMADELRSAGAALAAGYLRRDTKDGVREVLEDARIRLLAANPRVKNLQWKIDSAEERVTVDCSNNPELTDLSPLAGLPITSLICADTGITQLGVVTSLPLTDLNINHTKIDDLAPLAGTPLTKLSIRDNPAITSIAALKGMPLTNLDCQGVKLTDWSPLKGLPLQVLSIGYSSFTNFALLTGMPLQHLSIDNLGLTDLNGLRGLSLRSVSISGNKITDLSPLVGMPLDFINIGTSPVVDLTPLLTIKPQRLGLYANKSIKDLSLLRQIPLIALDLRESAITDIEMLKEMKNLRSLNTVPSVRLLPATGQATAAGLELRAMAVIDSISSVPALAETVAGLKALIEVAAWKQRPGNTPPPNCALLGTRSLRFLNLPVTWDEARRISAALGGRLACLEDGAGLDFAKKTWPGKVYFLGANRTNDTWKWVNNNAMRLTTGWEGGRIPKGAELRVLRASDQGLSDTSTTATHAFLVEWAK